jgi:hypothetical protein
VKGIRRKPEDPGPDPFNPRQLPSGRWIGCRHYVPTRQPRWVGFDPKRALKFQDPAARRTSVADPFVPADPAAGLVPHDH